MEYFDTACLSVDKPTPALLQAGQFWCQDEPVIDQETRVVLRGGMWEPQLRWWNLTQFIRAFIGGYGAGKTVIGSKRIISSALQNAPAPVATVSPTYPLARKTVIPTITELLAGKERLLGRAFWWKFLKNDSCFKVRYHGRDGTIYVQSGEDPLMLRGPNLARAWIDEPFIQDEGVFHQMVARVRHPGGKDMGIDLTGTPEQLNWGHDLCIGKMSTQHDVGVVSASTRANKALDPNYVKRLEGSFTDKAAEAYIEGKFVNLSTGLVFYGVTQDNFVDLPFPDIYQLGVGMDFNVNPMAATVFWRAGSYLHFFAEIEQPNSDTQYICSLLNERYVNSERHKANPLRIIYPDATGRNRETNAPGGKSDFHYIEEAGFIVEAPYSPMPRRDLENAVNGKLRPAVGRITLTIGSKCQNLRKYLSIFSHELKLKQKHMGHLLDAFAYPIGYQFPVQHFNTRIVTLQGH